MVTVDRSFILIADPASHAVVLPRLTAAPSDAPDQLGWWRGLARTDLVAIGLWDVKDADQAVPHPFQKGMAKGLSTEANVFAHLYFGLGLRTVPPDGRLRLVLDAADAQLAAQKIAGWQKGLSEAKARWAQTVPSVAALYDSLALHAQGPRSTVEVHGRSQARQESPKRRQRAALRHLLGVRWRAQIERRGAAGRAHRHQPARVPANRVSGRPPRLRSQRAVCRGRRADPGAVRAPRRRAPPRIERRHRARAGRREHHRRHPERHRRFAAGSPVRRQREVEGGPGAAEIRALWARAQR